MVLHAPLDIEYWFVNVFSGSTTLFTLLMMFFITYLSAKFKLEAISFTIILLLFAGIMLAMGDSALIVLMIFVLAPILFWILRRVVE